MSARGKLDLGIGVGAAQAGLAGQHVPLMANACAARMMDSAARSTWCRRGAHGRITLGQIRTADKSKRDHGDSGTAGGHRDQRAVITIDAWVASATSRPDCARRADYVLGVKDTSWFGAAIRLWFDSAIGHPGPAFWDDIRSKRITGASRRGAAWSPNA